MCRRIKELEISELLMTAACVPDSRTSCDTKSPNDKLESEIELSLPRRSALGEPINPNFAQTWSSDGACR